MFPIHHDMLRFSFLNLVYKNLLNMYKCTKSHVVTYKCNYFVCVTLCIFFSSGLSKTGVSV